MISLIFVQSVWKLNHVYWYVNREKRNWNHFSYKLIEIPEPCFSASPVRRPQGADDGWALKNALKFDFYHFLKNNRYTSRWVQIKSLSRHAPGIKTHMRHQGYFILKFYSFWKAVSEAIFEFWRTSLKISKFFQAFKTNRLFYKCSDQTKLVEGQGGHKSNFSRSEFYLNAYLLKKWKFCPPMTLENPEKLEKLKIIDFQTISFFQKVNLSIKIGLTKFWLMPPSIFPRFFRSEHS